MLDRRQSRFTILAAGLLVGLALGLVFFFGIPPRDEAGLILQAGEGTATQIPGPFVGAPAPDLVAKTVDGEHVALRDLTGQIVVLNFWATWCTPCREEMPALEARYERYGNQGLIVLAIDFDEPPEDVGAFRDEFGLTFPVVMDPGASIQQLYRVRGYPTTYFVDRSGKIQVQHIGVMSEDQLDEYLDQMGVSLE